MQKLVRWVMVFGLLVFFVQSPGEAASLVTLAVGLGERFIRAAALFVSQLAGTLA